MRTKPDYFAQVGCSSRRILMFVRVCVTNLCAIDLARYQLDAVLTALINELLVVQPDQPELWMATQLAGMAKSWDTLCPLSHLPYRHAQHRVDGVELPVLDRPVNQRLIVAETSAECEMAAALMLSELKSSQNEATTGDSLVAVIGLDTEWAPSGSESVVC